jgi:photosystem II stability/assembly factor-like uncharacterized protein
MYHVWLVLDQGYIYFSEDGALSWSAQEEGLITANDLNAVWFSDENNGMCVGDSDTVLISSDGGSSWSLGTATGGANDLLCVTENDGYGLWWTGDSGGRLWYTTDASVANAWSERTFSGSGAGEVHDIQFVNTLVGYMIHDSADPIGTIFKTINGGYDWEAQSTPTNAGLNALWACDVNKVYAVGEPYSAMAVVLKGQG